MTAMQDNMENHVGGNDTQSGLETVTSPEMRSAIEKLSTSLEDLASLPTDNADVELVEKLTMIVQRRTALIKTALAEAAVSSEVLDPVEEETEEPSAESFYAGNLHDFLVRVGEEKNIPAGEEVTVHIGWIISDVFDGRTLPQDEFHNFYRWLRDECELSVRTEDNQFTFIVPVDLEAILQAERQAELAFENFLISYAEENGFEEPTPVPLHINQIAKHINDRKAVKQVLAKHPSVTKLSGSRFIITFPAKTIETHVVEEVEAPERPVLKLVSDIVTIEEPVADEQLEQVHEDEIFANALTLAVARIVINSGPFRLEVLRKQIPQLVGEKNQKEYDNFKHHIKEFLDNMIFELQDAGYEAAWSKGGKSTRGTTYEVTARGFQFEEKDPPIEAEIIEQLESDDEDEGAQLIETGEPGEVTKVDTEIADPTSIEEVVAADPDEALEKSKPRQLSYDPLKLTIPGEIMRARREARRMSEAVDKIEKLINDVQEWGQTHNHWKKATVVGHFMDALSLSQKQAEAFLDDLITQGIATQRKEHGRAVIDWKRPTPKD